MQEALASGVTNMTGLARPLAVEPDLSNKILENESYRSNLKNPSTGIPFVDKMTMLSITWYEYQLSRLAKGKHINPEYNAWSAVFQTFGRMCVHAFTKRRM